MDLLTQAALGGLLAQALVGGKVRRAPLLGACLGVLPDADTLLAPLLSELDQLRWHRNLTHSWLACLLAAPLLGLGLARWQPGQGEEDPPSRARWVALCVAIWLTHVLLDCCTTFGTQVWQPFAPEPVAWRVVSVIDPGVTLPLLAGLLLAWRRPAWRARWAWGGLGLATLYLCGCLGAKLWIGARAQEAIAREGIAARRVLSKPTLFNALLWRVVVEDEQGFWVGYRSLLDREPLRFHRRVPRRVELWGEWAQREEVRALRRILDEAYTLRREQDALIVGDLRYGQWAAWSAEETPYVFAYRLREVQGRLELTTLPRFKLSREQKRSYLTRIRGR